MEKIILEQNDFNAMYITDFALCMEVVKKNGLLLEHIQNQTLELCIEAIKENKRALRYVNYKFYDECLKIVHE
jgi:hypothetical protein